MANREIEAILKITSKLGSMAALKTLQRELATIDHRAKAYNRSNNAMARSATAAYAATARVVAPAAIAFGAGRALSTYAQLERRIGRIGATAEASVADTDAALQRMRQTAADLHAPFNDVVDGAEALAASGKDLDQVLGRLPAVSRAAMASGADFADMATTADAVENSFGILEDRMEGAFDILAYGGKAGKFELRDMARELPSLAPAFAALGYKGEAGLKKLVAMLQSVRMETGTSEEAATSLMDVLTKVESQTLQQNFKRFGVDYRREMEKARDAGEDVLDAFMRISREAVQGDLSKLPQLFTDKQMLIGARALMNRAAETNALIRSMDNAAGTVLADHRRFARDTQAALDDLANSWDRLAASAGKSIATMGATSLMKAGSDRMEQAAAINLALEKRGYSWLEARGWWAANGFDLADQDAMAWEGGYRSDEQRAMIDAHRRAAAARQASADAAAGFVDGEVLRRRKVDAAGLPIEGPILPGKPAVGAPAVPMPTPRPSEDDRRRAELTDRLEASRLAAAYRPGDGRYRQPLQEPPAKWWDTAAAAAARIGGDLMQPIPTTAPAGPVSPGRRLLFGDAADGTSFRDAMRIDTGVASGAARSRADGAEPSGAFARMLSGMDAPKGEEAATAIKDAFAEGGQAAGDAVSEAARAIGDQAEQAGSTLENRIRQALESGAAALAATIRAALAQGVKVNVTGGAGALPRASGDKGVSMPGAGRVGPV